MKKVLLGLIATLTLSVNSFAEWNVDFAAGEFFNADGTSVSDSFNFALLVNVGAVDFTKVKLQEGDVIRTGEFLNNTKEVKTLITGSLEEDSGTYYAFSNSNWKFDNNNYGFSGGEEVALVVWNSKEDVVSLKDEYMIFTPSMDAGKLSGGQEWKVPTTNSSPWRWYLESVSVGGEVLNQYVILSQQVPEPSTYAAIFGLCALGYVITSRKRK